MEKKKLIILGATAVVLGTCAVLLDNGRAMRAPEAVGKKLVPNLDWSAVARIEISEGTNRFIVAASDEGWKVESLFGFPASTSKIRRNLLALQECSVGDVSDRELKESRLLDIQNEAGKSIVALTLGEKRIPSSAAAFPYGAPPADGRYLRLGGKEETLLVGDALNAFDGEISDWADTEVAQVQGNSLNSLMFSDEAGATFKLDKKDGKWTMDALAAGETFDETTVYSSENALQRLTFSSVVPSSVEKSVSGLDKPSYFIAKATDGCIYSAQIGAASADGENRYVALKASFSPAGTNETENAACTLRVQQFNDRNGKWIYLIPSSEVEAMVKKRGDFIKAAEEESKSGE